MKNKTLDLIHALNDETSALHSDLQPEQFESYDNYRSTLARLQILMQMGDALALSIAELGLGTEH